MVSTARDWMENHRTKANTQYNKNLAKVFVWLGKKQKPEKGQTTGASKKLWKFWVDYKNTKKVGVLLCSTRQNEKVDKYCNNSLSLRHKFYIFHLCSMNVHVRAILISRKHNTGPNSVSFGMKRDVRSWIFSCYQSMRKKATRQKHRHSLTAWWPIQHFCQILPNVMRPSPVWGV